MVINERGKNVCVSSKIEHREAIAQLARMEDSLAVERTAYVQLFRNGGNTSFIKGAFYCV